MSNTLKTLILTSLTAIILLVLFSAGLSFFQFDNSLYMDLFQIKAFITLFTQNFILFFIPFQISTIFLLFAYIKKPKIISSMSIGPSYFFVVLYVIILSLIFFILQETLLPVTYSSLNKYKTLSEQGQFLYESFETLYANEQYAEAKQELELYLMIDPENETAQELLSELKNRIVIPLDDEEQLENEEYLLANWINLALEFYESKDYFSALYYANRALELRPDRDDLQRIATQSLKNVNQLTMTEEDSAMRTKYYAKKQGIEYFENNRYVEAYYYFKELMERYPKDKDIPIYYADAKQKAASISFFYDEIESIITFNGVEDILFVNQTEPYLEIIHIDKIISTLTDFYIFGFEALAISKDHKIIYHTKANYGKILDNQIVTVLCIDRENDIQPLSQTLYISGDRDELENLYQLNIESDKIENFSQKAIKEHYFNLWQLAEFANYTGVFEEDSFNLEDFGWSKEVYQIEMFERIYKPFMYIILFILSINIGINWYKKNKKIDLTFILSLPIVPIIVYFMITVFNYFYKILFTGILLQTGFWITILALLLSQGATLFILLIILAKKGIE